MDKTERILAHKTLSKAQLAKLEYRKKDSQAKKGLNVLKTLFNDEKEKKTEEVVKWLQ